MVGSNHATDSAAGLSGIISSIPGVPDPRSIPSVPKLSDEKVSVIHFVLCKSVVQDNDGSLYLNGTMVQRIVDVDIEDVVSDSSLRSTPLFRNTSGAATRSVSSASTITQKQYPSYFPYHINGAPAGDTVVERRTLDTYSAGSKNCARVSTLDLVRAPLTLCEDFNW